MPDFVMCLSKTARIPFPTNAQIYNHILLNNSKFEILPNKKCRILLIFRCENKPLDMLVYGIRWEEND